MPFLTPTDEQITARREKGELSLKNVVAGAKEFGGGLVKGVQKEPFIALAIQGLRRIEGADPKGVDEIERRTRGSTLAQAGQIIGEFAPTLLFAIPTAGAGGIGGRLLVQGVAKKLAAKAALQDLVQTSVRGAVSQSATKKFLGTKLGQVARKAKDTPEALLAGAKPSIQGNPVLQRTAESAGANLAFGGLIGAQEKARGKSNVEALKSAAIMVALGGAIDTALVGGTRLLFPGSRTVDLDVIRANFVKSNAPEKLRAIGTVRRKRVDEINTELREVLKTDAMEAELSLSGTQRLRDILNPPVAQISGTRTVFHGTNPRAAREIQRGGFKIGRGGDVEGVFFSDNQATAKIFGRVSGQQQPRIVQAQIKLKNPASFDDIERAKAALGPNWTPKSLTKRLKSEGFDGVINDTFKGNEIVVFDTNQILSVGRTASREISAARATQASRVQELLAEKRGLKSVIRNTENLIASEGTLPYIGTGVSYVGPVKRLWDKMDPSGEFRLKWTTAAESLMGTFGSTGNRIGTQLIRAVTGFEAKSKSAEVQYSLWSESVRKAMGASQREWKNGTGKNLNSAHAWETGDEAGLRAYMQTELKRSPDDIERAVAAFKKRDAFEWQLYQVEGRKIGAKPPVDLQSKGLKRYLTHSSRDIPEDELVAQMVKSGKFTEQTAMAQVRKNRSHLDPIGPEGVGTGTPARTGPLDFDRLGSGSTRDKIGEGVPLNPNVWDSGLRTVQSAHRRIELHPILGDFTATERGRAFGGTIDELVGAVQAEGFNGAKFKTMLETIAGRTYYNETMRKAAVMTTSVQVAAKLPLAFLANASQAVLTTTWTGVRASLKGAMNLTRRSTREEFAQALAVHEHIIRGIGRSVDNEGLTLTSFEKAADWTLRFTGFSRIERFNRIHGAAATQVAVRTKLARAAAGRLRGTNLDSSRRMLGELGLDLDVLARELNSMGPEAFFSSSRYLQIETDAVIRGAQKTQFFPGKLRTPTAWSSPVGRVLFQFKTFATGQSRFFRDAVLTEWSNGNIRPMATLLSLSPIAGELVGDARGIIKGKDRTDNGIARFIDNFTYIGGLGLATDIWGQARWGNLEGFLLGPTFNDLKEVGEAVISAEGEQIWKIIKRQTAYTAGSFLMGAGAASVEGVNEFLDSVGGEGESPTTRIDVGQQIFDRTREKRER